VAVVASPLQNRQDFRGRGRLAVLQRVGSIDGDKLQPNKNENYGAADSFIPFLHER
jgi:hypothetical protein